MSRLPAIPKGRITPPPKSDLSDTVFKEADGMEAMMRFENTRGRAGSMGAASTPPEVLRRLEDATIKGFDPSRVLHGPLLEKGNVMDEKIAELDKFADAALRGQRHMYWMKCQEEAAKKDASMPASEINFVIPQIVPSDTAAPFWQNVVMLCNSEDVERIARLHVKKQPNLSFAFFQSVIATTDNAHWRNQRDYLNEVFLPFASLSKIFPTSLARAETCAKRLGELSRTAGPHGVQMHEFYLHEAQAQLQMALFGMEESFMEKTNAPLRRMFSGNSRPEEKGFGTQAALDMLKKVDSDARFATATESMAAAGGTAKPVFGPLSKAVSNAVNDLDMNIYDQFGNMMLILFAGHDTTAHTMTWLTYELAHHPAYQRRVQAEVDALFDSLGSRGMEYKDCNRLPFLTRCIMETLRLWTAVPNGTFRQLQYDDQVTGPNGDKVTLKKGTYVQITNWMRHRSTALWGPDANAFNPDRHFKENEIWDDNSFHGTNPASKRFSPFTFAPRDCLGKNFAQMEMRTIMANVLRRFTFVLSEPYKDENIRKNGPLENVQGTMGPRDLTPEGLTKYKKLMHDRLRPNMAMYLHAVPRQLPGRARAKM